MLEEKHWVIPKPLLIPEDFQAAIGGHPLVAQTLYQRGYRTVEAAQAFLNLDSYQPTPPDELPDMRTACTLLADAIQKKKQILIWGDFDVDGQTATTTLVEGLRDLGGNVTYHIPIRADESHGITRRVLNQYLDHGFDLLLTCDTGISEHEHIALIREAGKTVIVTDHHTLGKSLPPANAVINPQRLPEKHPLRTLPGVGVAYELMKALFGFLGHPFKVDRFSELAALGIVADVALLHGDTRYLLQKGLASLRKTDRVGLQTLYNHAGLSPLHLNEAHIGFQIAPRLNAVGRLGDANPMVEFMTTQDASRARVLATQIEAMNAKRRFTTRQVEQAAESQLQSSPEDRHAPAIVLHHPGWPGGVVGIVASRLVERYQKPVILLTGDDPIHGSARSIEGINITEAIAAQAGMLTSFGGHPMAAGLSLPGSAYPSFKRNLLLEVEARSREAEIETELMISQTLMLDEINFDLIEEIQRLAPFGHGNPPLNFMIQNLTLVSTASVGSQGEHRQVLAADEKENQQRFIWWNSSDEPLPEAQFNLVCSLSRSDYKGNLQISAEWITYQLSRKGREEAASKHFQWIDHRLTLSPLSVLDELLEMNPDAQVWGEGDLPGEIHARNRSELGACETLIIWTAPPSQQVFQEVIQRVSPKQVVVFGFAPQLSSPQEVLTHIGGLAKYAIQHKNGQTSLDALASVCAADQETIRVGLQLWEAKGKLNVEFDGDEIRISKSKITPDTQAITILSELLEEILAEAQAFRQYFKNCDLQLMFR